jgi:transcriptional regulator with XRE-family HTH domain
MGACTTFGGWVTVRPVVTGASSSIVKFVGLTMAVATFAVLTGGVSDSRVQLRRLQPASYLHDAVLPAVETEAVRTPLEDLLRIREVLSPAISDLAITFGVTRQSVYNWLNGEPVADPNAAKLRDVAQAADFLAHEGVTVNSTLLKRKFSSGRTLLQVAQGGESARDAAAELVRILRREADQRARIAARFAARAKTPATADFDLPAADALG